MSTRYTPWGKKAEADSAETPSRKCYGVDRMEMQQLRAISEDAIKSRDPAAVMMKKVEKHFKNVERTTIRKCARSTSLRLPDVRQMVARLIDFGVLERDGEIWEDSVQSGQRNAAAYRWKGERK